jgi:hypothetical protein
MATVLFILSLAVIPAVFLSSFVCRLACEPCRKRHEQMKVAMHMRVARDLAAMRRATQFGADQFTIFFTQRRGRQ